MGAVTTERTTVPGCRVQLLGVMRYAPVAAAAYVEQYLGDGFTADAVAAAPSLAWNRDDALQDMLLRRAFRRTIGHLDVPLFWQCWKLESPIIKTITDAVQTGAAVLRRHRK